MSPEWTYYSSSFGYPWNSYGVYNQQYGELEVQPMDYLQESTDGKSPMFKSDIPFTPMNYPNPIHKPTFEAPAAYTYPSEPTAAKVPIIKSDPTTPTFNFNRPTSPSPTLSSCAGSSSLSSGSQDLLSTVPTASILKSSDSPSESPPAKRLLRRRGRPRLPSPDDENFDPTSSRPRRARLPHNQVERKYRQGLNAELDRLRLAIPILPQPSPEEGSSAPKPSKATVLASAIKYIQGLESERDLLKEENSELRKQAAMMGASAVLGKRAAVRR